SLQFSTFLGGSGSDYAYAIASDSSGNAYVTGYCSSTSSDFPTTSGAYDTTINGGNDIFVTKLTSTGGGSYSTFLGGSSSDYGYGIDVDSSGNAYVTGYTGSSNFPTTSGAYDTTQPGGNDVFVTKFNSAGSALSYSTYLGGTSSDYARYSPIKVDSNGNAYIAGQTYSSNFPVTSGAYQSSISGSPDGFMVNLSSTGSSLSYSTYLGGSGSEYPYAMSMDKFNCVYMTGYTYSSNYPTVNPYQSSAASTPDAFVSKIGDAFADNQAPSITDGSDSAAYTGQQFDFSATITDNVGLVAVHLEYWFGTGTPTNVSFSLVDDFDRTIVIPNSIDTFYYFYSAKDYHGNWGKMTTKSLTPIDTSGPTFSNAILYGTPTTGGSANVTILVSDNVAYDPSTVTIYYRDSQTTTYSSASMARATGDRFFYVISLSNYWDRVYLYFRASDYSSNVGTSGTYYFDVLDNIAPTFVSDDSDTAATTGDQFDFSITMNDNIDIDYAYVEYYYGTGTPTIQPLGISSGGYGSDQTGTASTMIPFRSTDTLYYRYHFRDRDNNWWASGPSSYTSIVVTDNDPPTLTGLATSDAYTRDPYKFSAQIDDNIDGPAVASASIEWCYNEDWINSRTLGLTYDSNSQLWNSSTFVVQSNSLDPITFEITFADHANNEVTETGFSVNVYDNDDPEMNADNTALAATTGDPHNFTMIASDNIAIQATYLNLQYGTGSPSWMIPMEYGGSGNYFVVQDIRHTLVPLYYNYTIVDSSDNDITTPNKIIAISDNDPPEIFTDMTRLVARAGETDFPIKTMVFDNIEIGTVTVEYWYSFDSTVRNLTMTEFTPGIFYVNIDLPTVAGTLYYQYTSTDVPTGNFYRTGVTEVEILDATPPEITDVINSDQAYTGDEYSISATITDDIGVTTAVIYYYFGDETPMFFDLEVSGDTYSYTIPVPDSLEPLYFWLEAWDLQENMMMTETFMVPVLDNDDPLLEDDLSDMEATTGDTFMLKLNATDNIGIGKVEAALMYPGSEEWETHEMDVMDITYWLEITMPNDVTGVFSYHFTVYDTSMNMFQSEQVDITVIDDESPVAMIDGPSMSYQFEEVLFTAMGSSDNVGIVSYLWEINGETFTEMDAAYTFVEVGIYTVELKVSDGVNPTVSLVHDIEVLDAEAPEIVAVVPEKIGSHETLVVNASASTDNVGIVTFEWLLILPDNTRITGSDATFEYFMDGVLGDLVVHLKIFDAEGNSDSEMYDIESLDLLPPVVVAPEDTTSYEGSLLKFRDANSWDNVGIKMRQWTISFGDLEVVKVGRSMSYLFEEEGIYNITLTLTDANNNTASEYFLVTIEPLPLNLDSDGDGMPDWWEDDQGLDKTMDDASRDYDNDLLTNLQEFKLNTDPKNADTDGDELPDNWEYEHAYDEGKSDLVGDIPRWMDEFDSADDTDNDGTTNLEEFLDGSRDPTVKDAREEKDDNTLLIIVIAVIILAIGIVIVLAAVVLLGKVKPVEEEFPEGQFPHLYRKEGE
ncbi:MAG: SBBP repeat-containing protein, partial [Thermoplasmatota archaeon]